MFIIYDGQKLDVTAQDLAEMARNGKINADTDVSFKGEFHKAGEFKELRKIFDAKREVPIPIPKKNPQFNGSNVPVPPPISESKIAEKADVSAASKSMSSTKKIMLFVVAPLAVIVVLLLGVLIGSSSKPQKDVATADAQQESKEYVAANTQQAQESKPKLDEDTQTALDLSIKIIKSVLKNPYTAKFHPKECLKNNSADRPFFLFEIDVESTNGFGGFTCESFYVFIEKLEDEWDCHCINIDGIDSYICESNFSKNLYFPHFFKKKEKIQPS